MKILRKLFAGISLTAAMFVFQACYGTEPVIDYRTVCFRVVDAESGNPVPNVRIIAQWQTNSNSFSYGWREIGTTDSTGICMSFMEEYDLKIKFSILRLLMVSSAVLP